MISRRERVFNYTILVIFALIVVVPVGVLVTAALSPYTSGQADLRNLTWSNFSTAWTEAQFPAHLMTSITISVVVVLVILVLTPLAGYALSILRIPGHQALFVLFLAGIMIPLEGIIVPLYFTMRSTPLGGTIGALIIAHIGLNISFGVFWMRATYRAIPRELIESAQLDGAGSFRIFTQVAVPLTVPAMVTLGILTFMWTWNDYFLAFVLISDPDRLPITVALGEFANKYTNSYNLMSAAALLVALPIVAMYVFFQRHFIDGVLSGALKG